MKDNDVPGVPDGPGRMVAAEHHAELRELCAICDITCCVRCLASASAGGGAHRLKLSAVVGPCPLDEECCHRVDNKATNKDFRRRYARNSYRLREEARRRAEQRQAPFEAAA